MTRATFRYALQSLLQQRMSQLEAIQIQLRAAQQCCEAARRTLHVLQDKRRVMLDAASRAPLDPTSHRLRLAALLRVDDEIAQQRAQLDAAVAAFQTLQADCWRAHQQVEMFEEDRRRCATRFHAELQRQQQNAADDDWLMRTAHVAPPRRSENEPAHAPLHDGDQARGAQRRQGGSMSLHSEGQP